jgi:Ca2+-binding RTX toxin-like protein
LLIGGNGADQFRYNGGETGYDRINDFVSGTDKIALSTTGFIHTATVDFVSSGAPAPTSTNSTFLYDGNTGILSYDADGTGAGAAVVLAQLNAGLSLTVSDFIFN